MKLEVLVSTVNGNPRELVKKMNIDSDAIIINQCDTTSYEEFNYNNHLIKVFAFNERGIGISRNNALMRSTADIIIFADDDEIFSDDYEKTIINEFKKNQKADFIVFDILTFGNKKRRYDKINKIKRIHWYNCLKYGAVRFAVKRESLIRKNIYFSLLFGGGAQYGSGEDSLFIFDCIKEKMNVFSNPYIIAKVDMSNSTWFDGYNEKYYRDKGALFSAMKDKKSFLYLIAIILKNNRIDKNNRFLWKLKKALDGYFEFGKSK